MAQQNARYLIAAAKKVALGKGDHLKDTSVGYLLEGPNVKSKVRQLIDSINAKGERSFTEIETCLQVYRLTTVAYIFITAQKMQAESQRLDTQGDNNNKTDQVWNHFMSELVNCSKLHSLYFMCSLFWAAVERQKACEQTSAGIKNVLQKLCNMFALRHISDNMKIFLELEVLLPAHSVWVDQVKKNLARDLRNDAVSLVDSFNIKDFLLGSVLGKFDGDVYKHYFDEVNKSRHQLMANCGKPFYWEEHIKPLLHQDQKP